MSWRVLPLSFHSAAMNMALDESIGEAVLAQRADPTIRLYGWKPSAVSIGCFQSLAKEVDLDACRGLGVDIVRRRTGGGAVFHDRFGEITYSLIKPERMASPDINQEYRTICGRVIEALGTLKIKAEFHPINDILVLGKKISGSAQTRRGGVFLQHGTVLYSLDVEKMFSVLRVSPKKVSDKGLAQPSERVTCLRDHSGASMNDLATALRDSFTKGIEFREDQLTEEELKRARELVEERYSRASWNASR